MILTAERVLTPDGGLGRAWVGVADGAITQVSRVAPTTGPVVDLGDATLAPGYVDIHGHGGGGAAYTDGIDAARRAAATHLEHGTTATMASLVTDTLEVLDRQVRELTPLVASGELLGIHLEGPWLSSLHCGAHDPALLRDPAPADVVRLIEAGDLGSGTSIAMITIATERPGGLDAVRAMTEAGVLAALGHSHASYDDAHAAIDAGATVATHLYNAERAMTHRDPGLILALLERDEVTIELISDGVHVHPGMLALAAGRKPGRTALVTDSMAAAGSEDGDYDLGPLKVEVRGGVARLAVGGAIAGSTLTMDRAVRYAVSEVGMSLGEALLAATLVPATVVGRSDLGRIVEGARADLVVLDSQLGVQTVLRAGELVAGRALDRPSAD